MLKLHWIIFLTPVKNKVNYQNSYGSGEEIKLFKLFMIHKQKYMQFLLKSYSFRSMLHRYVLHCLFSPFSESICKMYKGPIFRSTKPNAHRPFGSSRAILAGQQLKRALMALSTQPGKKVYSCDVGMAGFNQHLLSSEMKFSLCTSLK